MRSSYLYTYIACKSYAYFEFRPILIIRDILAFESRRSYPQSVDADSDLYSALKAVGIFVITACRERKFYGISVNGIVSDCRDYLEGRNIGKYYIESVGCL